MAYDDAQKNPDHWFSEPVRTKILELYSQGYGTATIGIILKISGQRAHQFLRTQGVLRTRVDGLKARGKRPAPKIPPPKHS